MDKRDLAAVAKRLKKTADAAKDQTLVKKVAAIRKTLFARQLDFMDDPIRHRVVLCPRRSGKTTIAVVAMISLCLERPKSSCVYITMTMKAAKKNIWTVLKQFNDEHELGAKFNNTELSVTFPNASTIVLGGAETAHDVDKYRGAPHDLIILDESKSFPEEHFEELVEEVLRPCLLDRRGRLCVMGTPGSVLSGPFYRMSGQGVRDKIEEKYGVRRATSRPYQERDDERWKGVNFEYSFHTWQMKDNTAPKVAHMWADALAEHRAKGQPDDDPAWMREYLGIWIADFGKQVYKYEATRCGWDPEADGLIRADGTLAGALGLPEGHDWKFCAGVDIGYDDDFDIEVGAYAETYPDFFHVAGFSKPGLSVTDMAEEIKRMEAMFGQFEFIRGDRGGLGKAIFAEFAEKHGLMIEPADKQDKRDYIEILNADLLAGRAKILRRSNLAGQMLNLRWDEHGKEDKDTSPNHATDAWLYLCRHAYHHFSREKVVAPEKGTPAWYKLIEAAEEKRAAEEEAQDQNRQGSRNWWKRVKFVGSDLQAKVDGPARVIDIRQFKDQMRHARI